MASAYMLSAILSAMVMLVNGHSYHLGSCPVIEPVAGFNMEAFLGKWYVVQKTSTASSCLFNNYTRTEKPGVYNLEQVSEHFILGLTSVDHKYRYTGELSVKNALSPAKMTARFPLSIAGSAAYTVFMTDYTNYAAVFTCQRLAFAHRQSSSILSRSPTLDKMYLDKIRARMATAGIDPFGLSNIKQTDCEGVQATNGYDINIDPHTLSADNIAGVVRTAGDKIGDGIVVVADGAKDLYNRVKPRGGKEREELIAPSEQETEWLP